MEKKWFASTELTLCQCHWLATLASVNVSHFHLAMFVFTHSLIYFSLFLTPSHSLPFPRLLVYRLINLHSSAQQGYQRHGRERSHHNNKTAD